MILRCILISNFISNQPINWLYTPIELVDFFQPIELVSNWLIFAIFILSDIRDSWYHVSLPKSHVSGCQGFEV
jgi:hypothetical protein